MKKFNFSIISIAPLLIYALGLLGSKHALIGVIVYTFWLYLTYDDAEHDHKMKIKKRHNRWQA